MAGSIAIENDVGEEIADLTIGLDNYLLPDGSEMEVRTLVAWCFVCRNFVLVERLETIEEMEAALRRHFGKMFDRPLVPFESLSPRAQKLSVRASHHEALKDIEQWKRVLSTRLSPPRCLECTSADFVAVPMNRTWMSHPGTMGQKIRRGRVCLVDSIAHGRLFDIEGFRIPGKFASKWYH